ncbi:hypothetical protein JW813_11485 [Clostridium botulinum]|uniref:DUF5659 domain-containing protein n=1 Tax=Clostridium botulinum (strain Eklund 17B / Type B) TaxID=935198 RepID=B2TRN0_CLOBB|nr:MULTISPECIES: hypothetical protein [Clostridium]ACD24490.1 hypothetical protein CLL_A2387 [Clostridium botulinum B str. Eklund 17B (NRP)]MBN1055806.1 hypothetical protein [Clostridium botulinum]MBY6975907.1 hypothetical protein [Clostridium botulinum]MBY7000330.1 hypothetical protein [Clostridium botulinum]MCR1273090.1 hypothetical protein [Clostridium botulinum]
MNYKRKIVKSYIDADKLMKMGFICLGVETNIKDNSKLIFWFDNNEEINKILDEISNHFKQN